MNELEFVILLSQVGLLAVIAVVDIRELRIHAGALVAFVCVSAVRSVWTGEPALLSALAGAICGGGVFWLVYMGGSLYARVADAPKETLVFGQGDAWLMAACGLAVGFPGALVAMPLAVAFGGATALAYLAHARRGGGYKRFTVLPYAQNIAAACGIVLLTAV